MVTKWKMSLREKKIEAILTKLGRLRNRIGINNISCGNKRLPATAEQRLHDQYAELATEYGKIAEREIIEKFSFEIQNLKKKYPTAEFKTHYRVFDSGNLKDIIISLNLLVERYIYNISNPSHKMIINCVTRDIEQGSLIIEIPDATFTEIDSEVK